MNPLDLPPQTHIPTRQPTMSAHRSFADLFAPFVRNSVQVYYILDTLTVIASDAYDEAWPEAMYWQLEIDHHASWQLNFFTEAEAGFEELSNARAPWPEVDRALQAFLSVVSSRRFIRAILCFLTNPQTGYLRHDTARYPGSREQHLHHWIIDTAVKDREDGEFKAALLQYKNQPRADGLRDREFESVLGTANFDYAIRGSGGVYGDTPWPELTKLFRGAAVVATAQTGLPILAEDDIFHILRELVRHGVDVADMWVAVNGNARLMRQVPEQAREIYLRRCLQEATAPFHEMLRNPFAEAPLHIRRLFANFWRLQDGQRQLKDALTQMVLSDGVTPSQIPKAIYDWIIECALNPGLDTDGRIRQVVENRHFGYPALPNWSIDGHPPYTHNRITLRSGLDPADIVPEAFPEDVEEFDLLEDVHLEATGSEINPRDVASVCLNYAEDASCSICRSEYERDSADPCMKLNACVHMYHMECLNAWLNMAHQGIEMVGCPECRAEICPCRPVAAEPSSDGQDDFDDPTSETQDTDMDIDEDSMSSLSPMSVDTLYRLQRE
jgi:hypothetical protein